MNLLLFLSAWIDKKADEREKERAHEIELKKIEYDEIRESNTCQSCESLKLEIAKLHDQNNRLIEGILHKPEENQVSQTPIEISPRKGTKIPWPVRKAMLEAEDRAQAKIIAERAKEAEASKQQPTQVVNGAVRTESTVEDLEKELEIN